jgi:hypothetical protein
MIFPWNDRQCLQQAVWVAQERAIDWKEIERWSRKEGEEEKFAIFRKAFEEKLSTD